jgi:tRNA-specific 2-thiouridylase
VQGHDHPWLQQHTLVADDLSWVDGRGPQVGEQPMAAKTRYRQADAPCEVKAADVKTLALRFPEAQWAVTPGQSAVLYQGEVCLGGGVIASAA